MSTTVRTYRPTRIYAELMWSRCAMLRYQGDSCCGLAQVLDTAVAGCAAVCAPRTSLQPTQIESQQRRRVSLHTRLRHSHGAAKTRSCMTRLRHGRERCHRMMECVGWLRSAANFSVDSCNRSHHCRYNVATWLTALAVFTGALLKKYPTQLEVRLPASFGFRTLLFPVGFGLHSAGCSMDV